MSSALAERWVSTTGFRFRPRCDGIDLQAWLTWALGRIVDHKMTRLDELLAWRYAVAAA